MPYKRTNRIQYCKHKSIIDTHHSDSTPFAFVLLKCQHTDVFCGVLFGVFQSYLMINWWKRSQLWITYSSTSITHPRRAVFAAVINYNNFVGKSGIFFLQRSQNYSWQLLMLHQ
jgi:hypothetical protein